MCDPWLARDFVDLMSEVPDNECDKCLPDCNSLTYTHSATAAPFRRCDFKNLGTSDLCNFDSKLDPPIWGQLVKEQYLKELSNVPWYVGQNWTTNLRSHVITKNQKSQVWYNNTRRLFLGSSIFFL